jgi:hypothetical protein
MWLRLIEYIYGLWSELLVLALKFYIFPSCVHNNSKMFSICKSELERLTRVVVDI